jgi:inner membrane protein
MLGYVIPPRKRSAAVPEPFEVPPDLRRRLAQWIDVDEVGADGFWLWFRALLPLLLTPSEPAGSGFRATDEREEHRRLVQYARDRARLSVICDQYARENQILARRIRALEGALRAFELAGNPIEVPDDGEAEEMTERYQPSSRRRPGVVRRLAPEAPMVRVEETRREGRAYPGRRACPSVFILDATLPRRMVAVNEFAGILIVLIGAILFVVELAHPGALLLIPATILIVGGILYLLIPSVLLDSIWGPIAIIIAAIVATVSTVLYYRWLAGTHEPMTTTSAGLVGEEALVVSEVIPDSLRGKVRIRSEIWSAKATTRIPAGTRVRVVAGEGVSVTVVPSGGDSARQ